MNKSQIFIALAIASLAGLALYENGQANQYAEKAAYYVYKYRNALQELTDKAEAEVKLQACLSDASGGDYCAVEYMPSGEISDVVLVQEGSR